MKNIYILPTDKPIQNIYITNDEEIKEGDWLLIIDDFETYVHEHKGDNLPTTYHKKIILTTDPSLAPDVQRIDDEFLQWFVKNPSCEEVEVGYGWIRLTETDNKGYWISIPDKQFEMQQEEPKITNCGNKNCQSGVINGKNPKLCKKCNPKEEPKQETHICKWCKAETWQSDDECYAKQETLEEAAESKYGLSDSYSKNRIGFIEGAKWQQERSQSIIPFDAYNIEVFAIKPDEQGNLFAYIGYKITNGNFHFNVVPFTETQQERRYSEEEAFNLCREFAIFVQHNGPSYKKQQEWFEQYKKK